MKALNGWRGVLNTTPFTDGSYNISVRVIDTANNVNVSSNFVEVIFDNTEPIVSLVYPLEGNYSGDVVFNASSSDANRVGLVSFGYAKSDGQGSVTWFNGSEGAPGRWNATFDSSVLDDGSYNLSVRSVDSAGNEKISLNVATVVMDNTLPELRLISPSTGDFAGSLLFNASSSDNFTGIRLVEFGHARSGQEVTWNSGVSDTEGYWSFTLDVAPPFEEGSYTVSVRSTDRAGNVNLLASAVQIKVDNSAPNVSLIAPVEGDFRGILNFNASSDSGVSDIKSVEFGYALPSEEVEWLPGSDDAEGYWTASLDTSQFADGFYDLSVRSTDFAGNKNLSSNVSSIVIDNSAPKVSLDKPTEGNYSGEIIFAASSDGGVSTVELVEFGYRYTLSGSVTWFNGTLLQEYVWQSKLNASTFTEGSYSLSVRSTDRAGNQNESLDVVEIVVDNTKPDVSLIVPVKGDFRGDVVFNASSSDGLSGVGLVEFGYRNSNQENIIWFNGTTNATDYWNATLDTSTLDDGSYNVSVRSTDRAGNSHSSLDIVDLLIDNSKPDAHLDLPDDGNYSGDLYFNASSNGGVSQVKSVEFGYSKKGETLITWFSGVERVTGVWSYMLDTTRLLDDAYTLSVRSTDNAGNVRLIAHARNIFVDNTLPEVSLVAPVSGDYSRDLLFNASSNDSGIGVQFVEFGYAVYGDNVTWVNATTHINDSWSVSVYTLEPRIPDGSYNVSVRSTDFAGNREESLDVVEIVIDNSQPGISLTLPIEGHNYSGNLPFRALSDGGASGVKLVEFGYRRLGNPLVTWFNGTKGVDSWGGVLDTTKLPDGPYSISVRGTEFSGNQNVSADLIRIVLDNTHPFVSFIAPEAGNYSSNVTFRASSDDALSDVKLVEFGYRNSPDVEVTWFDGNETSDGYHWDAVLDTSALTDGVYNLSVRSTDFAGNENLSETVIEAVIDNLVPGVSLTAPVEGNYSGDLLFNLSAEDDLSGIRFVEFGYSTSSYVNVSSSNVTWFDGNSFNVTQPDAAWPSISWFEVADSNVTESNSSNVSKLIMFHGEGFNVTWSNVTFSNSSDVNATWFNATWSNVTWSNATSNVTWPRVTWANATLLTRIWSEVSWSYAEESNGSWTATSDTTLLDDGFYTLNVRSTDFAGNVNEMLNLFDILVDNVRPSLSLIAPVPGSYGGDLVLNASSDDGLSGVQTVEFGYSGGEDEIRWIPASGTGDGNWITTLTTAGIDDGSYNVSVRSTDSAGNQHELLNVVEVILDNTPPMFSVIGPVEGNYSGDLAFILRSSDAPSGVELAEFGYAKPGGEITWLSGHTFDVIGKAVWHGLLKTAEIEDGYYVLSARVTDSAGNQNVSEGFVQVLVDNTLPGVSLDAPADGNYSGDLVFSASSTDDLSKVMSVRFGYKQRSDSITTWFNGTESEPGRWTASLNTTELDDDYYVLGVSSTDSRATKIFLRMLLRLC